MKPKLLWFSDINCSSGFGTVAENILKYLQVKYEIHAAGWNFDPRKDYKKPWKYYHVHKEPNQQMGISMDMVMQGVHDVITKVKPDVILTYADPWNFPYVSKEFIDGSGKVYNGIRRFYPQAKIIGYLTADAKPLPTWLRSGLTHYDSIAVPSYFSREAMQILLPNTPIDVIYHGIDPDIYKPLPKQLRDHNRQLIGIGANEFVVGFNGRNQFRKNIPGLLRAFKYFHDQVPNSRLLLMTEVNASNAVHEVKEFITRLGLMGAVTIPGNFGPRGETTCDQMAALYNCMDVYMSLAYAEGYGLPVHEAMACGVPVLHTNYSAPVELIEESQGGMLIDVGGWVNEKTQDRNFAVSNEHHAAELLMMLYQDVNLRTGMSNNAAKWAIKHTWLDAAKQFDKLIIKTLKQPVISGFPQVFFPEILDKEII
jgi:glycosyltransferase involved in cell wall biosynthesis